jgi:hypothetical protein
MSFIIHDNEKHSQSYCFQASFQLEAILDYFSQYLLDEIQNAH